MNHKRYSLYGAIIWVASIQYFVAQVMVAAAWKTPYSLTQNYISDLGNTSCQVFHELYVCSPLHTVMNSSFILQGLITLSGALLFMSRYSNQRQKLGFYAMALSGVGTVVVGLFPENSVALIHQAGAALPFVIGNLALVLFGLTLRMEPLLLRGFAIIAGVTTLTTLVLFLLHVYGPLGIGGAERLIAYPQTIFLILFGLRYLSSENRASTRI